jgi:hypothetical protein
MFESSHFGLPFAGLDAVWRQAARVQVEAVALTSRRVRAYMDIPQTLAVCSVPDGLMAAQIEFWRVAQLQYQQGFERSLAGITLPAQPASEPKAVPVRVRDYMVVKDASKPAVAPLPAAGPVAQPARQAERIRRIA